MAKSIKIPVGISKPLYERIRNRAEAAKRSITAEVEYELEFYERAIQVQDSKTEKGENENEF